MIRETAGRISGSLADLVSEILGESEESAREYLRQSWLSGAISALRHARVRAGLTQEEVAKRMGTLQPAVARLENDFEGRITLHRLIDYALACNAMPLDLVIEPFHSVRNYALKHPECSREQVLYHKWIDEVYDRPTEVMTIQREGGETHSRGMNDGSKESDRSRENLSPVMVAVRTTGGTSRRLAA